jgi:hypothetical protein
VGQESRVRREAEGHRTLRQAGAEVLRKAKHGTLYRLPNGRTLLLAGSPGDKRGARNFAADLKRAMKGSA